ncbi:MAG: cation transporter [bacterium]
MMRKLFNPVLVLLLGVALFSGCSKNGERSPEESNQVATANVQKVTLDVQGMTCSGCEYNVESALKKVDGVAAVKADYKKAMAEIQYDPSVASVEEMVAAVNKTGYKASAPKTN